MKKIAILAAMFGCFTFANADEVLQISPVTVNFGESLDDSEATFDVSIPDNATNYQGVNFELYVPQGVEIDDTAMEGSGLPSKTSKGKTTYDHTIGIAKQATCPIPGYDMWKVMVYNTKNSYFLGGELFSLYVAAETLEEGVYPVYMREVKMSTTGAAGSATEFAAITTYLKVGANGSSVVEAEGLLPETVTAALATETAIRTLDLTNVTAVNGDFTYVAGRNVVAPSTSVAANVKFEAPLAGKYGSFCAPVDVNVDCYTYSSCDGEYAVFSPATTAPAGVPVLLDKAVKTEAQAGTLQSVQGIQISNGYYVATDGSGMHSVNTIANIPALRGAWDFAAASSNLRIAIETATGLQVIGTAEEVFGNSYDLQGRQVQNAKNGVFVVNGKKQFVK